MIILDKAYFDTLLRVNFLLYRHTENMIPGFLQSLSKHHKMHQVYRVRLVTQNSTSKSMYRGLSLGE